MKHFSLLKKLSVLGATAIAVSPIVLSATSCTPTSIKVDAFNYNEVVESKGIEIEVSNYSSNFRSLLYGSNSTYEGNYILFVGSNMFDTTCKFFSNNSSLRDKTIWYGDKLIESFLWNGINAASVDPSAPEGIKNFGIYNAIDHFDGKVYDTKGHRIYVYGGKKVGIQDRIGPFDKWTSEYISQTKIFNRSDENPDGKYDWDDESVTTDDYIRTDAYAKAYRALCERGLLLYPKDEPKPDPTGSNDRTVTFDTSDNNKTSLMLVFKDGVLKTIENIPSNSDSFKTTIIDNFKKGEDEPEPEPEPEPKI